MASLHNQNSRPARGIGCQSPRHKQQPSLADLERRIRDLETIAEWRDDLTSRIRRAELRFEFVGFDEQDQELLHEEVETFKLVCKLLEESGSCSA